MHSAQHLEFAPPAPPGGARALLLALIIHGLLMAALTWGVGWNKTDNNIGVQAELWSALPQWAAPKGETLEPEPQPEPKSEPKPKPKPEPPKPTVKPTAGKDAELAIEKRKKAEKEKEDKLKAEQEKKEKLQKEKEKEKQKAEQEKKEKAEEKKREALRQENIRRAMGLAEATGPAGSTGKAAQTSGPSASYAGKVRGAILPNITFTELDKVKGNPEAEVEVQCAPEGTIVGVKLVRKSGFEIWDDAVQKAVLKTAKLPRDTDGRIPCPMLITFRPQDQLR